MVDENKVLELLAEQDIKAEVVDVKKNNHIVLHGVCAGDGDVRPTLYFKDFNTPEQMVSTMIEHLINVPDVGEADKFRDWDWVKDRLRVMLSKNPVTLLTFPGICDLKTVAYIKLTDNAKVTVSRDMFEQYGRGIEPFFARAINNTNEMEGYELMDLNELTKELIGGEMVNPIPYGSHMMVLTNKRRLLGASALLYLYDVEGIPSEFCMIPSSIHEVLLVWPTDEIIPENLNAIIKEINASCVAPEEVLSDHAYMYKEGFWREV